MLMYTCSIHFCIVPKAHCLQRSLSPRCIADQNAHTLGLPVLAYWLPNNIFFFSGGTLSDGFWLGPRTYWWRLPQSWCYQCKVMCSVQKSFSFLWFQGFRFARDVRRHVRLLGDKIVKLVCEPKDLLRVLCLSPSEFQAFSCSSYRCLNLNTGHVINSCRNDLVNFHVTGSTRCSLS